MAKFRRKRAALLATAAGAIALVGSVAYASIPAGGVVHGCYKDSTGALRVIDSEAQACNPSETALDWNVAGAQGPQGPPGPQGSAGPQGPPGAAGVSGWEIVRVARVAQPSTDLIWTVNCSGGKKVVGGGVTKQIIGDSEVIESGPTDDGLGWISGIDNLADFPEPVTFYAICVSA